MLNRFLFWENFLIRDDPQTMIPAHIPKAINLSERKLIINEASLMNESSLIIRSLPLYDED
jgi:hypothetical protein